MPVLVFYYLILPFLLGWLVLKLIRRYGADPVAPTVRQLCVEDPVERKWFRVAEVLGDPRAGGGVRKVSDFETQDQAVEEAYRRRAEQAGPGRSWLVLNEKGDVLQEVA